MIIDALTQILGGMPLRLSIPENLSISPSSSFLSSLVSSLLPDQRQEQSFPEISPMPPSSADDSVPFYHLGPNDQYQISPESRGSFTRLNAPIGGEYTSTPESGLMQQYQMAASHLAHKEGDPEMKLAQMQALAPMLQRFQENEAQRNVLHQKTLADEQKQVMEQAKFANDLNKNAQAKGSNIARLHASIPYFENILQNLQNPSRTGDQAFILGIAKIQNPDNVRINAQTGHEDIKNIESLPEEVQGAWARVQGQQGLSPELRIKLAKYATGLMAQFENAAKADAQGSLNIGHIAGIPISLLSSLDIKPRVQNELQSALTNVDTSQNNLNSESPARKLQFLQSLLDSRKYQS